MKLCLSILMEYVCCKFSNVMTSKDITCILFTCLLGKNIFYFIY